jgi:type IV pilus assembly protein PilB
MLRDNTLPNLARHLIQHGLLDTQSASLAIRDAETQHIPLISFLVKNKILTSLEIAKSCEKAFDLPITYLNQHEITANHSLLLSSDLILQYRIIPLEKINNILHIGTSDPTDQQTLDAIAFHTGFNVMPVLLLEDQVINFIETQFSQRDINKNLQLNLLKQISVDQDNYLIQDNTIHYDEPLVKFVDNIIQHAFQQNVSDIHIEPHETVCRIRYRQHGVLHLANEFPLPFAARIITRLKVMARLDISERRLPQDGRFQLDNIDIRINTCPTLFGEKVVLRLLNSNQISLELDQLGLSMQQKNLLIKTISQPQGMILVTGPTGSGKTITLYSVLKYLNQSEKNISTVEDPIEIRLFGINQVNINPKIGLDFSTVSRTFLRQDPDIIMVGEIRDTETAGIAIQAAQTGHLVLSTLHTNSAVETITRLQAMGVLSYHVACSISLIIAQRLIRKLCDYCKQPETIPDSLYPLFAEKKRLHVTTIYRPVGCSHCFHGYINRTAVYEFLPISETISKLIIAGADIHTLTQQAQHEGFITLKESMLEKVLEATTSLAEIHRVLQ